MAEALLRRGEEAEAAAGIGPERADGAAAKKDGVGAGAALAGKGGEEFLLAVAGDAGDP
jgi:hypothetical protein